MARQAGPHYIIGTIGDLVFYKMGDNYYVREKGEPTTGMKKRLKDKNCYPLLNLRKREFGEASQLAKEVYRTLPRALRGRGVQQRLTGKAVRMLRDGKNKDVIKALLVEELMPTERPVKPLNKESVVVPEDIHKYTANKPEQKTLSNWQVSPHGVLGKKAGNNHAQPQLAMQEFAALATPPTSALCVRMEPGTPRLEGPGAATYARAGFVTTATLAIKSFELKR